MKFLALFYISVRQEFLMALKMFMMTGINLIHWATMVKVNILGQDYVVRSAAGQKYLEEVASYVNEKMDEIKNSGIDDSQQLRIAVLAAMNITDELYTHRKEKKKFVDKLEAKTLAINDFVNGRIEDVESSQKK